MARQEGSNAPSLQSRTEPPTTGKDRGVFVTYLSFASLFSVDDVLEGIVDHGHLNHFEIYRRLGVSLVVLTKVWVLEIY